MNKPEAVIERIDAAAFTIPTHAPESDGTIEWTKTTVVLVTAHGAGAVGYGYAYADRTAAHLIAETLAPIVCGRDAFATRQAWDAMEPVRPQPRPARYRGKRDLGGRRRVVGPEGEASHTAARDAHRLRAPRRCRLRQRRIYVLHGRASHASSPAGPRPALHR